MELEWMYRKSPLRKTRSQGLLIRPDILTGGGLKPSQVKYILQLKMIKLPDKKVKPETFLDEIRKSPNIHQIHINTQ